MFRSIEGDMRSFVLDRTFDAVTCLFSAIGYMRSTAELDDAIRQCGAISPGRRAGGRRLGAASGVAGSRNRSGVVGPADDLAGRASCYRGGMV